MTRHSLIRLASETASIGTNSGDLYAIANFLQGAILYRRHSYGEFLPKIPPLQLFNEKRNGT